MVRNVTRGIGEGFALAHTSEIKITYCSVKTPFDEEETARRTDEMDTNDAPRILIHDEQDEEHDITRFLYLNIKYYQFMCH